MSAAPPIDDSDAAQPEVSVLKFVPASDPTSLGFKAVRTKRAYEYIYESIRGAIEAERLKPGDKLPAERDLAEVFKVSRQAVREAIRGLESNGMIETRLGVHGGAFVSDGDLRVVSQAVSNMASLNALTPESVLEARILLTSDVIRLACQRATAEDLRRIEADIVITEERYSNPGADRTQQISRFYRLLAEATHNEVLVMLNDALAQAVYVRLIRGGPPVNRDIGVLRRRIVEYVRHKDADAAIRELTAHFRALEDSMK
ncbi:FadR/GntR family transcriptional regulator [Microbacterium sp. NPDC077663]|uniref:FadR/GntR family transcriptional regulator n=1 Tax=Microbacterium sp. NPDC077663 TaxID=3364189 RepID=UPI0037C5542A